MKFNTQKTRKNKGRKIRNHEGGKAYTMSAELELYSAVVTAGLANNFYESGDKKLQRIIGLVQKTDPVFVAKLAIYTREKMYLRSIPLVLCVELARQVSGDGLVKNTVARVIQRADEITELLAYYQLANQRKGTKKLNHLSKQLQKGVAAAFNKFDEYQFAKYNRQGEVKLKDALFLTHPKPRDTTQEALFQKIATDTLEVPYTWEVVLSRLGQNSFQTPIAKTRAFRKKWEELISSGKLGYMALMRNLRNILEVEVSAAHIKKVAATLSDPDKVRRSKQLPFRFLAAYKELSEVNASYVSYLQKALEQAVRVSIENLAGFGLDTRVLLASDVSGSMCTPVSGKSTIQCYDVGLLLSMLLHARSDNVITGIFGNSWKAKSLPQDNILSNVQTLRNISGEVGYATNGHKVIKYLMKHRIVMDKVLFFTDMQLWNSGGGNSSLSNAWNRYKQQVAPKARMYLFDLLGYGQAPLNVHSHDVYLIAGWSDKVFEVLEALENGKSALSEIQKIKF